jgi:mutator protein MutT
MTTVVAAIIERRGRFLVCQRRRDAQFPSQWEFPGGKVRPGESLQQALQRELAEELGVTASIGRLVYHSTFTYSHRQFTVALYFFSAALLAGDEPRNLAFQQILWSDPRTLLGYDFLPADRELVAKLAAGELLVP